MIPCNPGPPATCDGLLQRVWRGLVLLPLAAAGLACGAAPSLPGPVAPLVPTADEPFRSQRPAVAASEVIGAGSLPEVQEAVLGNGLTLWVTRQPALPYVALSVVARGAGSLNDTTSAELIALTTRAMVEGGTLWTNGEAIDPPSVHGRGVSFAISPSHATFELPVLRPALAGGIEVLARTVHSPAWAGGDLDPIRLAELRWQQEVSDVSNILMKLTVEGAYGAATAARFQPFDTRVIKSTPLDDVRRCHAAQFRPEQSALIAVGDVTLAEVRELATRAFASWPRSVGAIGTAAPPRQAAGRQIHFLPTAESQQASLLLLQSAPASDHPQDELPFALLSEVAIGAFRSRANEELRNHSGLTYGLHPRSVRSPSLGLMAVEADIEASEITEAIEQLLGTFEALIAAPVSSDELERARRAYADTIERLASDNTTLANLLAQTFAANRPAHWLRDLPAALAAVTAQDLQRVARAYLDPNDVEIGVAGSATLANRLAFVGRLKWATVDARP